MKTAPLRLRPYPETKVYWGDETAGTFLIETPWILVDGSVDVEHVPAINNALQAINNFDASPQCEIISDYFLQQFSEYPLGHVTPRKIEQFTDSSPIFFQINDVLFESFMAATPRFAEVSWNIQEILTAAKLEGCELYDAASIVTALRRQRLLHESSNQNMQDRIKNLVLSKHTDTRAYVEKMRSLLEHALFITSNAVSCLSGGLKHSSEGEVILKDFILSEMGHDQLISKSLKVLGGPRDNWMEGLHKEVKVLMEVLRFAANSSLAAQAALIESFEGVKYDNTRNSIWNLLDAIPGYPNASGGVFEHQRINDAHNHSSIGVNLAGILPPISKEEAVFAIKLNEIAALLSEGMFQKLYNITTPE